MTPEIIPEIKPEVGQAPQPGETEKAGLDKFEEKMRIHDVRIELGTTPEITPTPEVAPEISPTPEEVTPEIAPAHEEVIPEFTPEMAHEEPTPAVGEEEPDPEVCIYCGSTEDIQKGHLMAPSKGGQKTVSACAKCNHSKGDKALMEWLRWVKEHREERWQSIVAHNKGKRSELAQKIHKIRDEPGKASEKKPEETPKEIPSTEALETAPLEDDKFQKLGFDLLKLMEKTVGTEGAEEEVKPIALTPEGKAETAPAPEEVTPEITPAPEEVTPEITPAPEEVTAEITPAPEEVTPEIAPTPEEVTPEIAPTPEEVTAEITPAPEEVTLEIAPTPEEVTPEIAPAPEEVTPEIAPAPEEVTPEIAPTPEEVTLEIAPAPEDVVAGVTLEDVAVDKPKTTPETTPSVEERIVGSSRLRQVDIRRKSLELKKKKIKLSKEEKQELKELKKEIKILKKEIIKTTK